MKAKTAVESTPPNDEPRDAASSQTAPELQTPGPVAPSEGLAPPDDSTPNAVQRTDMDPAPGKLPPDDGDDMTGGPDDAPRGEGDLGFGFKVDGTPRTNNRGRRGAAEPGVNAEKAKQHARLKSVTPSTHKPAQTVPNVTVLAVVNYQALGETAASLFFNVPAMVLGEDWLPNAKEGEPQAVAGAFRDYFKARDVRDIPPGFALALVLTVYSLKRAQKPTIGSKLQQLGMWIKSKTAKLRR